jgi:hypothetical protein
MNKAVPPVLVHCFSMTRQCGRRLPALTLIAVLTTSGSSQAQPLRRDTVSNGVAIGAGTGTAAGAVFSLATDEVCSPGACAYVGGVAGGLIGLLVDGTIGRARPAAPGSRVDDGLADGAFFGALGGVGIALVDAGFRCRPGPDRGPCTRDGVLLDISASAQWMALVGLLIDAAIPSKVPAPGSVRPEKSQRRLRVAFTLRF